MDSLRQLIDGIVLAWRRLSVSARVNLFVATLATAGIIAFMVFSGSRPTYVRLFDGVSSDEMSKIVDTLSQEGVSYKLEDQEHTVLVPMADRSRMRLALSSKGLPSTQGSAPGFELFKEQDLMSNRWLQDVKYMRAVQGELQRQLNEFDFINKSFVFIREAKDELFVSQQKPSEAAVTLDVKRPLTKQEIKAVLHTISSFGGANLSVDNITLTTTEGTPLHLPPSSEFASLANSKLEYLAELEKQREDRVVKDFERIGLRALVKVSAIVDFDSQTDTINKADEGTPVSTMTTTTTTSTKEALPQGAPGAMANPPEGSVTPGGTSTTEEKEESIENYQPTTTESKIVREAGKVKRYIVGVLVEGESKKSTDASGKETVEYVGLTQERRKVYEDYVRAAVGEGEEPTEITLSDQPFDITKLTEARTAFEDIERAKQWDVVIQYGLNAGKVALVLIGFMIVRNLLRRAVVLPRPEEALEESAPTFGKPTASPEDIRREEIAGEVARLSEQEPEAVAALLRSWLAQEEE